MLSFTFLEYQDAVTFYIQKKNYMKAYIFLRGNLLLNGASGVFRKQH